jgi:TatD DNase family protein
VIEYFDSHCHLTDAAFRDDREAVFRRAREAGVTRLVTIASTLEDARGALAFAEEHEGVWSTAGIHPHAVGDAGPDDLTGIAALARGSESVVAIGETGLDYYYDNAPRSEQRSAFDAHLTLGAELGRPVVVHAREADEDVAAALDNMPAGTLGVLHCFTGGDRAFAGAMDAGWYVSFSGIASFKSFGPVDLLREVPVDRLLIETDSPYLAPVPRRGRRNEPAYVVHVAEAVAGHLGIDARDVAGITTENARRLYGVA